MKHFLFFLLLLAGNASLAQVFTLKTIYMADSAFQFPLLVSSQRPNIAKALNTIIQNDLGGNPDFKNPFDSVAFEDEYWFDVGAINERVICLTTIGAHSGCGYHVSRNHYIFDARTGAPVDMNKIFGAGDAKLRKALIKLWIESIKPLVTDEIFGNDYKDCLARAQSGNDIHIDRMMVLDGGVRFHAGYCLDGSNSQIDQTSGPYDLSLGQLLPMLTPYGFSLFVDKPSGPIQSLLRGMIDGKYPISLMLTPGKTDGTIGGMIVYDRIGQPINVEGTHEGNQLVFHELDEKNNRLSDIEVSWDGKKLTGSFTNLKTKKQLGFAAEVVK